MQEISRFLPGYDEIG